MSASSDAMTPNRREHCTPHTQTANIDDCLTRLGTDYLDVWRPMFRQDGQHPDRDVEVSVEAFAKAHKQGKARWLGISSHNRTFLQHVIEKFPQFSVVIFPYTAKSKVKTPDVESVDPAQVVEVGTGARNEDGKITPMDVKKGDRILFGKWSGTEVKLDGEELIIMKESDIMGVLETA